MRAFLLVACAGGLFAVSDAFAVQREVSGRVTTVAGQPLGGAAVVVKGTTLGTVTDDDGAFRLSVPEGPVTLVVRFVGYKTREVPVDPGVSRVDVVLETDVLKLEELVVIGRATEISRRVLPNAVAVVSDEELDRAPVETIDKALQGKVAGATIDQNSGAPGGGVQVRLRGVSTINALSEPLYVVDGVIVSNAAIPNNQNAVTRAAGGSNPSLMQDVVTNRIADINPEEIENIEILKGPSAAAIYGSKAANGVIVITTKKGRPGRPRLNVTQRFGFYDMQTKLGFRNFETVDEAVAAFGEGAREFFDPATGRPLGVFDHEELLAGRNDLSFESALSVSGGGGDTRYFAAASWKNDEGIITNTGFERQSVRLNLDQRLGDRFDVGVSLNLLHTEAQRGLTNNDNSGTSYWMVFPFTPNFVDLRRRPDGTFPRNPFERSNPLETAALMENTEEVWRFIGGGRADLELLRSDRQSLRLLAQGGVDFFVQQNDLFFPPELQFEPVDDGLPGTVLLTDATNRNLNVSLNAVYTYVSPGGAVTATTSGGLQYEEQDTRIPRIIARNIAGGLQQVDAATVIGVREERQRIEDNGFYLQEEVLIQERLLLTAGARFDRSSANGDVDKFFFYPKAAASYRLFDVTDFLDELKLRVAWGQTGNRPIFGQKFTPLGADRNIEGLPALVVAGRVGDPNLEPERQSEVEAGFDATLFDGRATLEVTAYQTNITNLLLERELAPSTGFLLQVFNGGELRKRGVEIALAATPIQRGEVTWVTRTTFFLDRNKMLDLPVPSFRTGGFGTALGAFQIEEGKSATQIVTNVGLDADGNVVVGKVGDATPDFRITFTNDLTVRRFNLSSLWDWQQGGTVVNLTKLLYDFGQNTADFDAEPGVTETIAGITVTGSKGERRLQRFLNGDSRAYFEPATYLKLRELALSYTLPDRVVASWFGGAVRSVRVSFSARNLLKFDEYSGMDPEVSNFGNQPIARNIDVAPFPPSRSFWWSIDVGF